MLEDRLAWWWVGEALCGFGVGGGGWWMVEGEKGDDGGKEGTGVVEGREVRWI